MIKKWRGKQAKCDICKVRFSNQPWFVDGRLRTGSWALMCARCYEQYGIGIGTGRGQKYDAVTKEKLEG